MGAIWEALLRPQLTLTKRVFIMTTTKKAAFKWTEENFATVSTAYLAKLEAEGKEAAADNEFLKTLADEVGAVSEKSIRGKLSREGVYQKPEHVACVAKTTKLRKEHFVRALINTLGLDEDEVDSLKNSKQCALEAIAKAIGIKDVEAASKTGFERNLAEVGFSFLTAQDIELDDVEDYILEQEAAETATDEAEKAE